MRTRENELHENAMFLEEMDTRLKAKQLEQIQKKQEEHAEFLQQLDRYRKQGELNRMKRVGLSESLYNEFLGDAFKAIYVTSLGPISERAESIAVDSVDTYIKESGGARVIMRRNKGKTYLLDTIFEMVKEAHDKELDKLLREEAFLEAEAKKAAKDAPDDEEFDFDGNIDDEEGFTAADQEEAEPDNNGEVDNNDDNTNDNSDTGSTSSDSNSSPEEVDTSDQAVDDLLDKTEDDSAADGEIDSDVEDAAEEDMEDLDTGEGEGADSEAEKARLDALDAQMTDEEKSSKEDMFEQLEDEDEVQNAVEIIANRINDAEAIFVRKNAQDKEKIENVTKKLSARIKGATEDPSDDTLAPEPEIDDSQIEQLNQESARMIKDIRNRRKTLFETMLMKNSEHILKSQVLREDYVENGKLDSEGLIETARVTYGFLEFVNTLQLEKVDEKYIKNYLEKY